MPGLDLFTSSSIQSKALTLKVAIARMYCVIIRCFRCLLLSVVDLRVLQLLRTQKSSLIICAVLLLIVEVRANHPSVFLLLVFHGVLKLILRQALHDITRLRLLSNKQLVLLDKVDRPVGLALGSTVLCRQCLLAMNLNILP